MHESNFEMYTDPIKYDRESSHFEAESSILLELAPEITGFVLELS